MKNLIKFLFVAALIAIFGFNARAQSNANADLSASATILSTLIITKNTDVAFGKLSSTTAGAVYLDPKNVANTYVGTTAAVGTFTITGSSNASVQLGYPATIILYNTDTTPLTMTYTLKVNGLNANTQGSSLLLDAGPTPVILGGTKYYLWVGGSLGTLSAQGVGIYSGTANFTVTYN